MSFATFVMTNIIPQAPAVNEKAWRTGELFPRIGARGSRLYIISGPAGRGGRGSVGARDTVAGQRRRTRLCWKVIVTVKDDAPMIR